jgi:archaellum biogenesis protein FlaJ (TadC family)
VIVISATVFGALLGAVVARRRGGRRLDMAHHAAAFAILFAVIGMVVTIGMARMVQG